LPRNNTTCFAGIQFLPLHSLSAGGSKRNLLTKRVLQCGHWTFHDFTP